jgi:hypothetical protein
MHWRWTFFALVCVQILHSLEEYTHRLYLVFPPARAVSSLFSNDLATGFAIVNCALILFGIWCVAFPVWRGWRSAIPLAWVWVVIEMINGVGHPVWAIAAREYRPGVATAILLLPLALILGWQLTRQPRPSFTA